MKSLVAAVAGLVALAGGAQAQTPEVDALRARAAQGDAVAQYSLGVTYAATLAVHDPEVVLREGVPLVGRQATVQSIHDTVDDAYADQIADQIAHTLEEDLGQHGQIKVLVVREVRAVHYAR